MLKPITLVFSMAVSLAMLACVGSTRPTIDSSFVGFEPQLESVPRLVARLQLVNDGPNRCDVHSYSIIWTRERGGERATRGHRVIKPRSVSLPPNETVERTVEIGVGLPDSISNVEVSARCS